MIYLLIAAVVGEVIFLLTRNHNGLDFRAREFSAALADREYQRDAQRRQARRALDPAPRHRAA